MTPEQRYSALRAMEGHLLQVENWTACLFALGLSPQPIPPGVLVEVSTALEDVAGALRERWMEAAGLDER